MEPTFSKHEETAPDEWVAASFRGTAYELLEVLGRGGMGVVYKARHMPTNRLCALKMMLAELSRDPQFDARLRLEAKALKQLAHPNIVRLLDVGRTPDKRVFYTMELLEGTTLREMFRNKTKQGKRSRNLHLRRSLAIALDLLEGLSAAHAAGIYHRDIKPHNVFVTADGPAKIIDFGVAKTVFTVKGKDPTAAGMFLGTLLYVAPEMLQGGRATAQGDVYSAGLVLFELLMGRPAFEQSESMEQTVQEIVHRGVPRLEEVGFTGPRELSPIVERATHRSPDQRYASADALIADLRAVLERLPPDEPDEDTPPRSSAGREADKTEVDADLHARIMAAVRRLGTASGSPPADTGPEGEALESTTPDRAPTSSDDQVDESENDDEELSASSSELHSQTATPHATLPARLAEAEAAREQFEPISSAHSRTTAENEQLSTYLASVDPVGTTELTLLPSPLPGSDVVEGEPSSSQPIIVAPEVGPEGTKLSALPLIKAPPLVAEPVIHSPVAAELLEAKRGEAPPVPADSLSLSRNGGVATKRSRSLLDESDAASQGLLDGKYVVAVPSVESVSAQTIELDDLTDEEPVTTEPSLPNGASSVSTDAPWALLASQRPLELDDDSTEVRLRETWDQTATIRGPAQPARPSSSKRDTAFGQAALGLPGPRQSLIDYQERTRQSAPEIQVTTSKDGVVHAIIPLESSASGAVAAPAPQEGTSPNAVERAKPQVSPPLNEASSKAATSTQEDFSADELALLDEIVAGNERLALEVKAKLAPTLWLLRGSERMTAIRVATRSLWGKVPLSASELQAERDAEETVLRTRLTAQLEAQCASHDSEVRYSVLRTTLLVRGGVSVEPEPAGGREESRSPSPLPVVPSAAAKVERPTQEHLAVPAQGLKKQAELGPVRQSSSPNASARKRLAAWLAGLPAYVFYPAMGLILAGFAATAALVARPKAPPKVAVSATTPSARASSHPLLSSAPPSAAPLPVNSAERTNGHDPRP